MSAAKIKQRRSQMLVHSYLYYELDSPIISDFLYDKWAMDLVELGYEKIDFYDDMFKDWTGASGYHLTFDGFVRSKAEQLLEFEKGYNL